MFCPKRNLSGNPTYRELAADSALSETTALRKLVTLGFLKLLDNFIGITVGFCDFWVVDNGFSFHDS